MSLPGARPGIVPGDPFFEAAPMKLIALEEHYSTPEVHAAWDGLDRVNDLLVGRLSSSGRSRSTSVRTSAAKAKIAHGSWERLTGR